MKSAKSVSINTWVLIFCIKNEHVDILSIFLIERKKRTDRQKIGKADREE